MLKEFVVSGDSHILEPPTLFKDRLPKHLRHRALWEEEFELDKPLVPGGHTKFRKLHTPGYEGWTVSRYRQHGGPIPDGNPEHIMRDLDLDGVDAAVMFPNLALFALFTDDHEFSMAHARVYNDYLAETFLDYKHRMRPAAPIPLTDIPDAVAEIERVAKLGLGALLLPEIPPSPYWSDVYEPVWAAAEAAGLPIFIHVATGGVEVKAATSKTAETVRTMMTAVAMGKNPLNDQALAARSRGVGNIAASSAQRIIADIISGGACDRHPNLHFNLVEFSAGWLVSYLGTMDRNWRIGIGQDPDWWLGFWDESKPPEAQDGMGQLFNINTKWPWPLKPSEYVQRQFHIQFADDPVAVQARHITGIDTIMWGNDYPHAEGTFRESEKCIEFNFQGVGDEDRAKILGGTLAKVAGFDASKKFAPAPEPV